MNSSSAASDYLAEILTAFDCQTGTIHFGPDENELLHLAAQHGIPDFLLEKISTIPLGKGIAGAAAATRKPVEHCNLQENLGAVAQPAARETGVAGSLAVPIFSLDGSQVIGTLGIGKHVPYAFSHTEKQSLAEWAQRIAEIV